ncbi:hypothetical protein G6011_02782 [Alternaria panax]|uniref:Uncharacterized protein n=1 Tax=Alternaria panax TaxID=48097 RepID=A0AAD4FBG8_9PLEO|nr:hypothetical protein G6011_02782 [Alternaria panax]
MGEMCRVRITNKHAMDIASRQAYGQLLSPKHKSHMEIWIEHLPYDWKLEDANTARLATLEVYEDWLDWSESKALSWFGKLSKFERRFRIAGVAYHKIPHAWRQSSSLAHSYRIDKVVLLRLSEVFETDRPRAQQSFFRPWNEIVNATNTILKKLKANKITTKDVDRLRVIESGFEAALSQLAKSLHNLEIGLLWIEGQVASLAHRSNLDGNDNLAAKHSREGGLFRTWIQTFPEIECGAAETKSEYTEGFVDALLDGEGIVEYTYST